MSSHKTPTDLFEVSVNEMLLIPEIQEMLKKATSKSKSVSTTATAARNCNTVTESQPDEPEEKIQVQEQDIGESHQLQSSPLSALGLSTEANTVKESQSTRQDISPTNFGDSTAKVVHEICGTERNELRRKAQVLTASLQQAKRNNMDVSYQQHQLEELQSELCRLLHIEAQLKEYEKRSVESIEHELQVLQQEVANLSKCVQAALQEELDWVAYLTHALGPLREMYCISPRKLT